MATARPVEVQARLPEALLADFSWQQTLQENALVVLRVPDEYAQQLRVEPSASEVLGIQRLITLAGRGRVQVVWDQRIAACMREQPYAFPLLAVLLSLRQIEHLVVSGQDRVAMDVETIRKKLGAHRLITEGPVPSDIVFCVEGDAQSFSPDLYDTSNLQLLPRESFETLAVDLFSSQLDAGKPAREVYGNAALLGTILAELIENADVHGRFDLAGRLVARSAVRGVLFRRIVIQVAVDKPAPGAPRTRHVDCFEASVFDSGVGYYQSYTREPLTQETDLRKEWMVLHKCLERHFYPELPDLRPAHRGMGLYEVLRALQALKGRMEFRTGRVYAYRTFMDGELHAAMEPRSPMAHTAWPKPRLLDVEKRYLSIPTAQEQLQGSSVRILVPLN
jgi:hypothetical protein